MFFVERCNIIEKNGTIVHLILDLDRLDVLSPAYDFASCVHLDVTNLTFSLVSGFPCVKAGVEVTDFNDFRDNKWGKAIAII